MKRVFKLNIFISILSCVLLLISSARAQKMGSEKFYADYNAFSSNCYNAMSPFGNQGFLMPNLNGMDLMPNLYNGMGSQMEYGFNMPTDMFNAMTSPFGTMTSPIMSSPMSTMLGSLTTDPSCRWAGGGMNGMPAISAIMPSAMGYPPMPNLNGMGFMPNLYNGMGYPPIFGNHSNLFSGGFMPFPHLTSHFNWMIPGFGWGGMNAFSPFMPFGSPESMTSPVGND